MGSLPIRSTKFCHSSPRGGQRIVYPYQVGSSPIYGAKFMDMMCQLPDAGMKFPNSIGERSGLDSHCCPPEQRVGYITQYESQGTAVNPWAGNSTQINVTGGSDLLTGQPQKLCPPYKNTFVTTSTVLWKAGNKKTLGYVSMKK